MDSHVPHKLRREPLLEAIFEVRFEPSKAAAGDLLLGLLYAKLGERYANPESLPIASLPAALLNDPTLKYQATHRLSDGGTMIQVGHRAITLNSTAPYVGWPDFRQRTEELVRALHDTNLIKTIERFSFRYINVICAEPERQLSLLDLEIRLMSQTPPARGFALRTEWSEAPYTHVVQVRTDAVAKLRDGSERAGVMVDVDTIVTCESQDFWSDTSDLLEQAHTSLKRTFFTLLRPETIESLQPIWSAS